MASTCSTFTSNWTNFKNSCPHSSLRHKMMEKQGPGWKIPNFLKQLTCNLSTGRGRWSQAFGLLSHQMYWVLLKLKMLREAVLHSCVQGFLKRHHDKESLECVCQLLCLKGKELELVTANWFMDRYLGRMDEIVTFLKREKKRKVGAFRTTFGGSEMIPTGLCESWISKMAAVTVNPQLYRLSQSALCWGLPPPSNTPNPLSHHPVPEYLFKKIVV